ncbi:hypothetical protein FOA52_014590 [Chlamydomonas sp. UWO 241]|nr:hypothetical protein FOA52_014590 [Chlamydomonas sp. UWO 241]
MRRSSTGRGASGPEQFLSFSDSEKAITEQTKSNKRERKQSKNKQHKQPDGWTTVGGELVPACTPPRADITVLEGLPYPPPCSCSGPAVRGCYDNLCARLDVEAGRALRARQQAGLFGCLWYTDAARTILQTRTLALPAPHADADMQTIASPGASDSGSSGPARKIQVLACESPSSRSDTTPPSRVDASTQVDPVHLRYTDASTQTTPEPAPLATSVARGTQVEAATLPPAAHITTDGTIAAERRAADAAMMRLEAGYLSIMQAVQQLRLDFNMQAMQPATMRPGAARDRRTFILHVTAVASAGAAMAVVHSVLQSLPGKWADGLGPSSQVVDANFLGARPDGTGGAARILFTVGSADVADVVVRSRCGLKGSGSSIFEALSDRERAQHKALWPAYEAARAALQKVQFRRARLFVDGLPVPAPTS